MVLSSFMRAVYATTALAASMSAADARQCLYYFYGDSLAQGAALTAQKMRMESVNGAIPGVGILNGPAEHRRRMTGDNLDAIRPGSKVLVSLGTNDFFRFMNKPEAEDQYKSLFRERIKAIQARGGQPIILGLSTEAYAGFTPAQRDYLNTRGRDLVRGIAMEMGVSYIETTGQNLGRTDGLHYSDSANRTILRRLHDLAGACP